MKLSRLEELSLVEYIRNEFGAASRDVLTGIGDDAAILRGRPGRLLATTDMMLEGVHFDVGIITAFQLGYKLVSVNVSDIYAMGGRPVFVLLGLAVPRNTKPSFMEGLLDGVGKAVRRYGAALVGGDVSSSRCGVSLSATVLGNAERPVERSGARKGDRIYVTGFLGESACGLELLRAIGRPVDLGKPRNRPLPWEVMEPLLRRHLMPEARPLGAALKAATAMIDISDGLFLDLSRLCTGSGVGARIYGENIPVSKETRQASARLGLDPMRLATGGGEDYRLLFTARPGRKVRAHHIGEITESGLRMVDGKGRERPISPRGYLHFGGRRP